MSVDTVEFERGAVRPLECYRAGWRLIRNDYWLFLGISLVGVLIGGLVPLGILAGPMMCGIYLCLFRLKRGRSPSFELLFRGFDYFVDSLVATLIMMVPTLVIMVLFYAGLIVGMFTLLRPRAQGGQPDSASVWAFVGLIGVLTLVFLVISVVIGALFLFTYPLIVDRRLSGTQAVKTSFRAVSANLGGVVGLVLLNTLLSLVGVLACYVGVIFVMPLSFAANVIAYRQVFPKEGPATVSLVEDELPDRDDFSRRE